MRSTNDQSLLIDDIHAYYGDSYVLQGLSLAVRGGETVAVLGRNGVGKTTLIRSIIGFAPPARGPITYNGETISGLAPNKVIQRGFALVPQGRRIFRSLSVEETLTIAACQRPSGARKRHGRSSALMTLFRGCVSGARSAPTHFPAASSRCWRRHARWLATPV